MNALAFEVNARSELARAASRNCALTPTNQGARSASSLTARSRGEVFAADFRDRVVHHLLVSHQERVFEPIFIHDSYACRRAKGTLAASDRLMTFLRQVTANGRRPAWALKLDVASFFPSIHKEALFEIHLPTRSRSRSCCGLPVRCCFTTRRQTTAFGRTDRQAPGPESPYYPIPPHKSLFGKRNEQGLPIGNLTSQFWGNVYLNELDQFVKRTLKCRYYLRYVDDMVLLAEDRETLAEWCRAIQEFLREQLRLSVKPELTTPIAARRGIDFVGWKTWWNYRLPRRRTLRNLTTKLDSFERTAVQPTLGGLAQRIDLKRMEEHGSSQRFNSMLASYAGHLKHGPALKSWEELWVKRRWLGALFERRGWCFVERWSRRRLLRARSFHSQYWRLASRAGDQSLVCYQVGRFIEFYGPQRYLAVRALGLRAVGMDRGRFAIIAGFPTCLSDFYIRRAIQRDLTVVAVGQVSSRPGAAFASRLPRAVLIPVGQ